MNSTYIQFVQSCKLIKSDKTIERKQQHQKIIDFLSEQNVLFCLDKYSYISKNKDESDYLDSNVNWNTLFIICKEFVIREINQINSKSASSSTNENKVLSLRKLFNLIINQANGRGRSNLCANVFIDCLFEFIEHETILNSKLFNDLSNHLYTNILTRHKYCSELSKSDWLKLIKYYTKFYTNPMPNFEPICLCKCIQIIIEKSCTYTSFYNTTRLFAFFEYIFTSLKKDTSHDILDSLLNALNKLCSKYYNECFFQICKLGERIIPYLLNILNTKQADSIKILIVDFCLFQFKLHENAFNIQDAALLIEYDNTDWKDLINTIYDSVLDVINDYCERIKYSINKINSINNDDTVRHDIKYFQLAAYCLAILIGDEDVNIHRVSSQSMIMDNDDDELICLAPNKKRKLNEYENKITWDIFEKKLIFEKNNLQIYSWLAILECLIETFNSKIPSNHLEKIIAYLEKLLNNYKEIYIINKALRCLNLIILKSKLINEEYLLQFYNIYCNLYKYDLCKYEIYRLVENLIHLFHLNSENINKEKFLNMLLNNNYQIKFQNLNSLNALHEKREDLSVLQLLIQKFNIHSKHHKTQLIEWLFLNFDNYIIEVQNQQKTGTNSNGDEVDFIKTTQTENRIKNMRLNFSNTTQSSNSPFKSASNDMDYNNSNKNNQFKFNSNFLHKSFIMINLISKNKFHFYLNDRLLETSDCVNEHDTCSFKILNILFKNYFNDKKHSEAYSIFPDLDTDNKTEENISNKSTISIIEMDDLLYEKVELKLLDHCKYLSTCLPNIYETNFINYLIEEFFSLLHMITTLEYLNKKLNLNNLKFELKNLFITLYTILDKCFKQEKIYNNKFLLNTINLIINKFYFNLSLILNSNKNDFSLNKSIIDLLFDIVDSTEFINLCTKIIFEQDNEKSSQNSENFNEFHLLNTNDKSTNQTILTNFNLCSNFETIFHQIDYKIRLRLFSLMCYLSIMKYNHSNDDSILIKLVNEFKQFDKVFSKSQNHVLPTCDYYDVFNLTFKLLFLMNFTKYDYISFNEEHISINMLKYCIKMLSTVHNTQYDSNNIYVQEILLKLIINYSNILIYVHNFLTTNSCFEEDEADFNDCLNLINVLIENVYNSSHLNAIHLKNSNEEKSFSYDSIECHKLIVQCMVKRISLKTLLKNTKNDDHDTNDLFSFKCLHLITDKSLEIRNQVIYSFKSLFKNADNDYFSYIYENLIKLIELYSNANDSEENMSENNEKYKLVKRDYLNNFKTCDNWFNLRTTIFMSLYNLMKFSQYELKCQFALIQINKLVYERDLFNTLQLKYFVSKIRSYFNMSTEQNYFNYNYLILNWLSLDNDLQMFPYLIEYASFSIFLEENFKAVLTFYLVINPNREKLIFFYKMLSTTTSSDDQNILVKNCIKSNFSSILSHIFNNGLLSKKKTIMFCENKIDSFMKQNEDLSLNLKELIKTNFSSILLEILINFNEVNFDPNDKKSFKLNILTIICYLIQIVSDKHEKNAEENDLSLIQSSTKVLISLLIKSSNDCIHKILFELTQSIFKSYQFNDFIRLLTAYSLFVDYILFNDADYDNEYSCIFLSTDQQIFILKSISSTIINLVTLLKTSPDSGSLHNRLYKSDKLKTRVLSIANNIITKLLKHTTILKLTLSLVDSFVADCYWHIIDFIEYEFEKSHNNSQIITSFHQVFKNILNLVEEFSKKSNNIKLIAIYLTLLTKSPSIQSFIRTNGIRLIDIESITNINEFLVNLFVTELKAHFDDLCKYELIDEQCSSNSNFSIEFLIKCLLYILEKMNYHDIVKLFNKNNDSHLLYNFVIKLLEICKSTKISDFDLKTKCCKCLALIGPVDLDSYYYNLNGSYYFKTKKLSKKEYIFEKFQENDLIINQFYFILIEDLLYNLFRANDFNLSILSNSLLKKIFQTPTAFIFLQEYETLSNDYENYKKESKLSEDIDEIDYFREFIRPFVVKKPKALEIEIKNVSTDTIEIINKEYLWIPKNASYSNWLQQLCVTLIASGFLDDELCILCIEIFKKKVSLCETALPFIINKLVETKNILLTKCISTHLHTFFELNFKNDISSNQAIPIEANKVIIKVLEFLRIDNIRKTGKSTFCEGDVWKRLNYLHIAKSAQIYDLSEICLYYIEMWLNEQLKLTNHDLNINNVFKNEPHLIELLVDSYRALGELDIPENLLFLNSKLNKKVCSTKENNEFEFLFNYDNRLFGSGNFSSNSEDRFNLINSLKNCGLNYLLNELLINQNDQGAYNSKFMDLKYSCAVKLNKWNLESEFVEKDLTIDKLLYLTRNTFLNESNNKSKFDEIYSKTQSFLLTKITKTNNKNILKPTIVDLFNMEQIKKSLEMNLSHFVTNESLLMLDSCNLFNDFNTIDSIYANELFISKSLLNKSEDVGLKQRTNQYIVKLYEDLVDNSISYKRFKIGELYINEMKTLALNDEFNLIINYKHGQLLCEKSEYINAKLLLEHTIDSVSLNNLQNTKQEVNIEYYIKCLNLYANILDKVKCENPSKIMDKYLEVSIDLINKNKSNISNWLNLLQNAYFKLAKFSDLQLQKINDYMKSSTFEQKQDIIKKFKLESKEIEKLEPDSKFYVILRKQLDIDERELRSLEQDRELYLCKSIENYLNVLEYGNIYDIHIFRLLSLWTQNFSNIKITKIVKKRLLKINTYKFIPLMYQLAARMKVIKDDIFYETLFELIFNIAKDHPYHVLPIIFALSNAYKDETYTTSSTDMTNNAPTKTKGSKKSVQQQIFAANSEISDERLNAARYLIDKLKLNHPEIIKSMSTLFDAYIELANYSIEQSKKPTKQKHEIAKNLLINQIKNYKHMPVLTNELPVNKDCDYSNIVYISKFENSFTLAGGINLPKIINCLGSNGVYAKQLVKSKDDTRQDCIMQQFFGLINNLLMKNSETNKRRLTIRRYKVIPLSQKSGVIEWCVGTVPLGEWLVGDTGGAHKKYNPDDWLFSECRKRLHNASTTGDANNKKARYDAYLEIMQNFKPVFRHFFNENFLEPSLWYQNRLNYTRSVAASSIVGYIVGLGDRHVQNILIDKNTAEVIHIDLGIAFDQGKMLPTPETVPFRLTRDMIDGFGILGYDGIFTSTCEITMQLMLDSCEEIMTIFSVFLYDPLYNWSMSPRKAYMLQQRKNDELGNNSIGDITCINSTNSIGGNSLVPSIANDTNKIAENILFRLRQKLQGFENGIQLSCKGQINLLIQEAINPENLSRLYAGWQPYL